MRLHALALVSGISATPPDEARDVSSSGGYVYARGGTLSVGAGRVTAKGGVARSLNPGNTGTVINQSSPGYVVLQAPTVTGTTDPSATVLD